MEEVNIDRSIGRLEGKMDLVLDSVTKLQGAFETLEAGRLSKVEQQVAGLIVRVSLLAAGIPVVIQFAILLVQHYWH